MVLMASAKMTTKQILLLLVFSLIPAVAVSGGQCANPTIEPLAKKVANNFAAKKLATLDKERPYLDAVQFVVEHSITDNYEVEEMPNLAAIDRWLTGQEVDGFPAREVRPLLWCKKGLCVFDLSAGIAHNHRYVQKLTYGFYADCPYIKSVFLIDGD